jgi:hypothetical protein
MQLVLRRFFVGPDPAPDKAFGKNVAELLSGA